MGFTPAEVGAMSLWEFRCVVAAHRKNAPAGDEMSDAEARDLGSVGFEDAS